jgi:predicted AlkP superfamily phosphohydrolase/phosphomutase/tetratricopeptide (TPR) repeat protein
MKDLLLIGWDGADWDVINPLLDAGKMPNLKSLVNNGVIGDLATLYPELSPMLWTSIATGKRAYKHGIYGFSEPTPDGRSIRPISNLSRKTKAIWNILTQEGIPCHVIGWWPSQPVEAINGVMISNSYPGPYPNLDHQPDWSLVEGSVHPVRIARNLEMLRWHPQKLNVNHILPFVPDMDRVDQSKDHRLEIIARNICDSGSIKQAACAVLSHEPWRFAAVYFVGIDHFSHGFMNFHPPLMPWVSKQDFEIYQHVISSAYIFHDMLLGELLAETHQDTTVMLISDHGFESGALRPKTVPLSPSGPAAQHRQYGIFVMKGPNVKTDEIIYGPNLLDICPTILSLFDLPIGDDMDGKPLIQAFRKTPSIKTIDSWDKIDGTSGMHSPVTQLDPEISSQLLNQLVDLGYIDKPNENMQQAVKETSRELNFNLARSYMDNHMYLNAIGLLEPLVNEWPDEHRFGLLLVQCYLGINQFTKARGFFDDVLIRKKQVAQDAIEELVKLNQTKKLDDMSENERQHYYQLQRKSGTNQSVVEYLHGVILFTEKNYALALNHLKKAESLGYLHPKLYNQIGNVYVKMHQIREARGCFAHVLTIDKNNASAYLGLCLCSLAEHEYEQAAHDALSAIGYQYFFPEAHYHLGRAFYDLNKITPAVQSLEVAISQNPQFPKAYDLLAQIYSQKMDDSEKANTYREKSAAAKERIESQKMQAVITQQSVTQKLDIPEWRPPEMPIPEMNQSLSDIRVIVSGLPRSGTSMIMQMLKSGGLPLLTDNDRPADHHNPRGYFEYTPTRNLARDNRFLAQESGKGIKIIAQLLPYLNPDLDYRVIFILRHFDEIIASQATMLADDNKKGARLSSDDLKKGYQTQLKQIHDTISAMKKMSVLYVNYNVCVNQPETVARKINAFLGGRLNEPEMVRVVSKDLYRQRVK